jgi:hypothetical protein
LATVAFLRAVSQEHSERTLVAYEHWSSVRTAERASAYAAYRAALDWEEQASAVYADRVNHVVRELPGVRPNVAAA